MSTARLSWDEITKRPGFYEFADHAGCFMLITANGKHHYGEYKRITRLNVVRESHYYKPASSIPKDFNLDLVPKEDLAGITRGSKLLLLEKKPWKS